EAPPLANDGGDEHAEFGSGVDEAASDPPSSDEGAVNEEVESEVDEAACDPPSSDEGAVKVELKSELDEAASDPSSDEGALPHDSGDEAGSDPTSSDEGAPAARNPPSHAAVCESESGHEESESVGSDDEMDNPPFAEGVAQPTRKCSTKKEKLKKYWEQFKVGTFQEKIALERARNGLASSSTPAPGLCRPIARSESVDSPESSSSATLILGQHTSSERPRLHRSKPIEFEALDGRDAEMSPTSLPTPRGDGGSDGEESDSDDSASMPSLAGPGEFESMLVEASNNMHCKAPDGRRTKKATKKVKGKGKNKSSGKVASFKRQHKAKGLKAKQPVERVPDPQPMVVGGAANVFCGYDLSLLPEEAYPDLGRENRGQHSYTLGCAEHGVVEVLLRQEAFFVKKVAPGAPGPKGHISWLRVGDPQKAWDLAKERSGFSRAVCFAVLS
ncbi:Halomucin, partial [Durusdinium trenchii]